MTFIGRERELAKLKELYFSKGQDGILLYGRRRIGKSELIKKSLEGCSIPSLYFECTDTSEETNLSMFCELIGDAFHIPTPAFSHFFDAIEYLFAKAETMPIILVLDEYPYLREKIEGCDSLLQKVIDKHAMSGNMKFIVCGSFVQTMKALVGESSPLYKRFGREMPVLPMDYLESSMFYPNFSSEDKVRIYSVFGGVPFYNRYIDDRKSVKENIVDLLLSNDGRFHNEVESSLRIELGKMCNANEAFLAIGKGFCKFNDILSQSGVSSSPALADVLKKLTNAGLVRKIYPINDESEKKSIYQVDDRLSRFYFRYLLPRKSFLSVMNPYVFYDRYVAKDFEEIYVPKEFESVAKAFLIRQNLKGKIDPPLEQIGTYYYDDPINRKNGQFDVVTYNGEHYCFYEVKFTSSMLNPSIYEEERKQVADCGIKNVELGFFSRSGYIGKWPNVERFTLEDVYRND